MRLRSSPGNGAALKPLHAGRSECHSGRSVCWRMLCWARGRIPISRRFRHTEKGKGISMPKDANESPEVMAEDWWNRRQFLGAAAGVAAALGTGGRLTARSPRPAAVTPVQAGVLVRRNAYMLDPSGPELTAYRAGITQMRAWSAANPNDPRGWTYQAAIHGTSVTPLQPAWNTCPHHSYYFFTWHRAYLYYFERIVRKASGDASFALPYWNYSVVGQRQIPVPLRSAADEIGRASCRERV